jgi:hypothetical protein
MLGTVVCKNWADENSKSLIQLLDLVKKYIKTFKVEENDHERKRLLSNGRQIYKKYSE